MYGIKRYIALFLLAGFLFPQGTNSVHYFIFQHKALNTIDQVELSAPGYDYHFCNYHYNATTSLLPGEYVCETLDQPDLNEGLTSYYTIKDVVNPSFHYQLRGPPSEV